MKINYGPGENVTLELDPQEQAALEKVIAMCDEITQETNCPDQADTASIIYAAGKDLLDSFAAAKA